MEKYGPATGETVTLDKIYSAASGGAASERKVYSIGI